MNPLTTPWPRLLVVTVVLICLVPRVGHGQDEAAETTGPEDAPVVAVEGEVVEGGETASPLSRARQKLVDEADSLVLSLERLSADDVIQGLFRRRLEQINQAIAHFDSELEAAARAREAESEEVVEEGVASEQRLSEKAEPRAAASATPELLQELAGLRDRVLVLEVTLHFPLEGQGDNASEDILEAMEGAYARIQVIEKSLGESPTGLAQESLVDRLQRLTQAGGRIAEEPLATEQPIATEEPVATEEPIAAEPAATEEPAIAKEPTFQELREQILRLQREIEEIRAMLKSLME